MVDRIKGNAVRGHIDISDLFFVNIGFAVGTKAFKLVDLRELFLPGPIELGC